MNILCADILIFYYVAKIYIMHDFRRYLASFLCDDFQHKIFIFLVRSQFSKRTSVGPFINFDLIRFILKSSLFMRIENPKVFAKSHVKLKIM